MMIVWNKMIICISIRNIESIDRIPSWTGIGRCGGEALEVVRHVQLVVGVGIMEYVKF